MLKNTHIATSTALVLWFIFLTFFVSSLGGWTYFPLYPFLLLPILAVLPDADHPEGYLNQKFPMFKVISKIAWHRTWSHDLFTLLVVAILLYLWLGTLFWHFDIPFSTIKEWWLVWLFKFFFHSPNFLWIYIALAWHTFWDFLTKWSVKFFYWSEFIDWKLKKKSLLRYTIWLPFMILNKVQVFLNTIKGNIFPTTWSNTEKNVYALIANVINLLLILILSFYTPIFDSIKNTIISISVNNWWVFSTKLFLFLIGFIGVSVWYFFSLSVWKLKFYLKIAKNLLFYVIWMLIWLVVIYIWFHYNPSFQNYFWIAVIVYMFLSIAAYRNFIKVEFAYFNVILNEILLIVIYTTLVLVSFSSVSKEFTKQDITHFKTWNLNNFMKDLKDGKEKITSNIDKTFPKEQTKEQKEKKSKETQNKSKKSASKKQEIIDSDFSNF